MNTKDRCELCNCTADEDTLMEVFWVPEWLRETARAARTTRGVAQRIHVCVSCFASDPDTGEALEDGGMREVKE